MRKTILLAMLFAGNSTGLFAQSATTMSTATAQKYLDKAYKYDKQKKYDSAIKYYTLVLKKEPENVQVVTLAATACFMNKNYAEAEQGFMRAVRLKPGDATLLNNLGAVYTNTKNYNKAIPCFENAIKADPKNINAYTNAASSYYYSGKYQSAIDMLSKALAINEEEAAKYFPYIPLSYQKLGKMAEAKKYEKIAQQYYPAFKLD
jgi:tetratricopeptide (TPR) repeat protein